MTVEEYIKANVKGLASSVYVTPEIPEKKLNNAIVGMTGSTVDPDYVIAVIDATLFGKSDDGALFTGEAMYWHAFCGEIVCFKYAEIKNAKVRIKREKDKDGKVTETKLFVVINKDGDKLVEKHITDFNMDKTAAFLNEIVKLGQQDGNSFESTRQVMPLCDSDSQIKLTYVKLVANLAFSDDGVVDGDEFAAVYNLMVRNDFTEEERVVMRSYMFEMSNSVENDLLVADLRDKVPAGSFETTAISLLKDCIYLYYKKGNALASWRECEFIADLVKKLGVSEDKVDVIVQVIQNDEDILKKRKADSEIEKSAKELAAKAAAVGVPIAAVYFSGSVIGLSAAGITSGLASLGMGLGMVGGIGIAVLVGVGAYKAIKFFTSTTEVEACKQRELMIQNIIRNNQKTINYLVGDTNMIAAKLFELIEAGNADKEQIAKLKKILTMLNKASSCTTNGLMTNVKEQFLAKLPKRLNKSRFDDLTESPTKIKLRPYIYKLYPEKTESVKGSDGTTKEIKTYPIDDSFPNDNYEKALKILKAVEYLGND